MRRAASGLVLTSIGLCLLSVPAARAAPVLSSLDDELCSGGAPRLVYVNDVALVTARLTPTGPDNSTRRRVCAVDLVTCLNCHLEVTVVPSRLTGCQHHDPCRCHHLEMREQGRQYDPGVSDCSVGRDLALTSVGRTLDVRLAVLEHVTGELLFRVVSRENRFIFEDPAQLVETARFPAAYPSHYVAEYVIQRPPARPDTAILLSFTDYFVSPWALLEVLDDSDTKVATYSGDVFRPPTTITNTSRLTLRFHANGRPGAGFRAKFNFIPPSASGSPQLPPRTDCGGVVVSAGGAITMLNMTSVGQVWYDCVWLVRARLPPGHAGKLSLRLLVFRDFAPGSQLRIIEGQTTRGATVALITDADKGRPEATSEHVVGSDKAFYVHLQAGFRPTSQLAIVYSSFRHGACGLRQEMACGDGRCLALFLRCDGFAHCPDRSDEAASCYTYSLSNSLGVQEDDTWTLSPPNFYFPGPSHAVPSLESATLSLLAMCLIIVLTMTSAIIFIYSNGRVAERRARNRILQSISNLMRETSVEVVSAAADEPPDYEPPPDYEQLVHCFTVHKKRKRKRKPHRKAAETHQTSRNRRLPRHNTVPSLHHLGDWLRQHTHGRPSSTSPTGAAPSSAAAAAAAAPVAAAASAAATATATATAVAMAGSSGHASSAAAETPLTVQLPPEKEESLKLGAPRYRQADRVGCRCAGACGCPSVSFARPPVERRRHRVLIPRSKSADVLSSVLDDHESSMWSEGGGSGPRPASRADKWVDTAGGGGGGGVAGGGGGAGGGASGDRSPPPPYQLIHTPAPTPEPMLSTDLSVLPTTPSNSSVTLDLVGSSSQSPTLTQSQSLSPATISQTPPLSATNIFHSKPLSPTPASQSPPLSPTLPQSAPLSPTISHSQSPPLSPPVPQSTPLSPTIVSQSPPLSPTPSQSTSLSPTTFSQSPPLSPALLKSPTPTQSSTTISQSPPLSPTLPQSPSLSSVTLSQSPPLSPIIPHSSPPSSPDVPQSPSLSPSPDHFPHLHLSLPRPRYPVSDSGSATPPCPSPSPSSASNP